MKSQFFHRSLVISLLLQWIPSLLFSQALTNLIIQRQHTIALNRWTFDEPKEGDPPFLAEYDGKVIQETTLRTSYFLDRMKFEAGSIVKVLLPPGKMPEDNLLRRTYFLHDAIDDGASLVFYQGGKKLNYHTLMCQSLRFGPMDKDKALTGALNTDTGTYVLDGKKYFDGPSAAVALKKLPLDDLLIMVLFPAGDNKMTRSFDHPDKSEIDRCVEFLREQKVKFVSVGAAGFDGWLVPIYSH
ncbi:hypothetical protein [Prosthecobacter sp.]|uniref:hypothetical protein n=1 Tax=Prosthecobacter sp. TaxID=1965333 RepID=UPI0037845D5D